MQRNAVWQACVTGYAGTPATQQECTWLACAPVRGVRLTIMQDNQPVPCDDYFVADCTPVQAMACIRAVPPAPLHYITVCADDDHDIPAYVALGAHHEYSEVLMARDVRTWQAVTPLHPVQRATPQHVTRWNDDDPEGVIWLHPRNVADASMGHYGITVAGQLVARGRSLRMPSGYSYVSMVYVAPAWRQRGFGRAVMQAILNDDALAGIHTSTLMASYQGVALYTPLGYQTVAQTHVFTSSPKDLP